MFCTSYKEEPAYKTDTWQIHENTSVYPNTSPNSSIAGLFSFMAGNASSSLLKQKRWLNLDLPPSRQALWVLNVSRLGPALPWFLLCFQRFNLKRGVGEQSNKTRMVWSNLVSPSTISVWLPNSGCGRRSPSQKHNMLSLQRGSAAGSQWICFFGLPDGSLHPPLKILSPYARTYPIAACGPSAALNNHQWKDFHSLSQSTHRKLLPACKYLRGRNSAQTSLPLTCHVLHEAESSLLFLLTL